MRADRHWRLLVWQQTRQRAKKPKFIEEFSELLQSENGSQVQFINKNNYLQAKNKKFY